MYGTVGTFPGTQSRIRLVRCCGGHIFSGSGACSEIGAGPAFEGTQRLNHRLKVFTGYRHWQKMLNALRHGLFAKSPLIHSRDKAYLFHRSHTEDLAVMSPFRRVEYTSFTDQQIGIESVAQQRIGLRPFGRFDNAMAGTL